MERKIVDYTRSDERGKLIQVVSHGLWKQLNILEIKKGAIFGKHYHKHKTEYFYILRGNVVFNEIEMVPGECIVIEPKDFHSIEAIEDSIIVELLSEVYTQEDVFTE